MNVLVTQTLIKCIKFDGIFVDYLRDRVFATEKFHFPSPSLLRTTERKETLFQNVLDAFIVSIVS